MHAASSLRSSPPNELWCRKAKQKTTRCTCSVRQKQDVVSLLHVQVTTPASVLLFEAYLVLQHHQAISEPLLVALGIQICSKVTPPLRPTTTKLVSPSIARPPSNHTKPARQPAPRHRSPQSRTSRPTIQHAPPSTPPTRTLHRPAAAPPPNRRTREKAKKPIKPQAKPPQSHHQFHTLQPASHMLQHSAAEQMNPTATLCSTVYMCVMCDAATLDADRS